MEALEKAKSQRKLAKNLSKLNALVDKKRAEYNEAIANLVVEIEKITGKEIQYNDFADDGLGIAVGDSEVDSYMGIGHVILLIKENGTITEDDLTYM